VLKKLSALTPLIIVSIGLTACSGTKQLESSANVVKPAIVKAVTKAEVIPVVFEKRSPKPQQARIERSSNYGSFANKLSNAALSRLRSNVRYDGAYIKIGYPWGDVPANIGVCTDVVIRSYRKLGIDLQQQVHQDMSAAFNSYPNPRKWGLSKPDTNIDHRRVYNLRAFFARRGAGLPITRNPTDYRPGDLVTWMVGPDLPHIGVVVDRSSKADPRRKMIVHNIANGPQIEDILFRFRITGHYRYTPDKMGNIPTAIYASRAKSKTDSMNYTQLVEAANRLANVDITSKSKVNKNIESTMDRVDQANLMVDNPIEIATLNNDTVRELLNQK